MNDPLLVDGAAGSVQAMATSRELALNMALTRLTRLQNQLQLLHVALLKGRCLGPQLPRLRSTLCGIQ